MIGKKLFYKSGMGICILAGVGALLYYGIHRYDEQRVNKRMEQLRQEVYIYTEKNNEKSLKKGKASLTIDFSKLKKVNSDIQAWILIIRLQLRRKMIIIFIVILIRKRTRMVLCILRRKVILRQMH